MSIEKQRQATETARAVGWLSTPLRTLQISGPLGHVLAELVDCLWRDAGETPARETLRLTVRITSREEAPDEGRD